MEPVHHMVSDDMVIVKLRYQWLAKWFIRYSDLIEKEKQIFRDHREIRMKLLLL